jgi:hypothetical protein
MPTSHRPGPTDGSVDPPESFGRVNVATISRVNGVHTTDDIAGIRERAVAARGVGGAGRAGS